VNYTGSRWFRVTPIGHVRRPTPAEFNPESYVDPFTEATLEILPRWADAIIGLEEYSHLLVIFWFDRVRRARKTRPIFPEGRAGLPGVGIFATRTPRRPNPLGLSTPRLLRREGRTLWVLGIDAWDGTPILDLKGYAPRDDLHDDATVPEWLESLWAARDEERSEQREDRGGSGPTRERPLG
jgi:tRNA-Thr(GGU) m(6)t(6)A37 methyltransferase TsaA